MQISQIKSHLEYDPDSGCVYVLKNNMRNRQLIPNEDMNIIVRLDKTILKMKFDRLIWCIYYGIKPKHNEVVFHKDLDPDNTKINNLILISSTENFKILEALKNLSGALRIIPHPTDAFSYVLEYKNEGRTKKELIKDVTIAKRKLLKMQLKYIKFLGKYVISI